jgi:lysophospholipase L1-like esterase
MLDAAAMRRLAGLLPRLLLIAEIVVILWIFHNIAYTTTYRLYISHRVDDASRSSTAQRFGIEGAHVVPQIAMHPLHGDDRVAFHAALGPPSTLVAGLRPEGRARYEIRWHNSATERVLAAGDAVTTMSVSIPIPSEAGVVELVSHGALTWVDPRLVREPHIWPYIVVLSLLVIASVAVSRFDRRCLTRLTPAADHLVWFRRVALGVGGLFVLVSLESGLRALGDRIPSGIATERHDLGEVRKDPRWEDTVRYGRRLRARVDATNEWRHGDIVRMGYIPPEVSDGALHRFRFQTDEEGFRNARTRARIDIAALGDSFTDAMTLDARDGWTNVLERTTGLAVQNYGTAGFGPQQELRVLIDYVLAHRPRTVVLAYFAGNDLFDAEAFDEFDRSGGTTPRAVQGWQIKDVVSRADTWFVVSALRAAGTWASRRQSAEAKPMEAAPPARAIVAGPTPLFDRGMFTASVNGQAMRWSFMPPYLNTLNFSETDLTARIGWTLTRRSIAEMQRAARATGAELVVMFLPFKSQIYLPLVESSMSHAELTRALQFFLRDNPAPPDVAKMMRNRLAQNTMMRRFCDDAGIRFLDTTDALTARVRAGENVYFPDESHLNETGHRVVADTLAGFLDR